MLSFEVVPSDVKFNDCVLITGFHGIGVAGFWAVKYLVQKMEAERVASIDTDAASPISSTNSGKIVTPFEFFKKGKIVLFKAEIPPYREVEVEFFRKLSAWIKEVGFSEVVLIGGLDSSLKRDDSKFRIVHTTSFKPTGILESAPQLEDEQIIVGPVATLLNRFEIFGFPAYAFLAYASRERIDPRAAATTIETLGAHYDFKVDVDPLIKGAEAIETEVTKQDVKQNSQDDTMYT